MSYSLFKDLKLGRSIAAMRYASIMLAAVCSFTRVWAESYATIYQPTYHSTYRTDSIYGDAEVFKLGSSQVVDFDTSWSAWSMYLVQYLPNSDQDLFGYTTIVEREYRFLCTALFSFIN